MIARAESQLILGTLTESNNQLPPNRVGDVEVPTAQLDLFFFRGDVYLAVAILLHYLLIMNARQNGHECEVFQLSFFFEGQVQDLSLLHTEMGQDLGIVGVVVCLELVRQGLLLMIL